MAGDNKDPSFPWYPKDFANDEPVQLMSLEAEGAYHRLLDHQWLNGSIPADIGQLAAICKRISSRTMRKLWSSIAPLFVPLASDPGRLYNRKLERIRTERSEYRARLSEAGKRGADTRWNHGHPNSHPISPTVATPLRSDRLASASALASVSALASSPAQRQEDGNEPGGPGTTATRLRGAVSERYREDLDHLLSHVTDTTAWCLAIAAMASDGTGTYADIGRGIHDYRLNGKAEAPQIGLLREYVKRAARDRLKAQQDAARKGRRGATGHESRPSPEPSATKIRSIL